jgi:hypothetical protein
MPNGIGLSLQHHLSQPQKHESRLFLRSNAPLTALALLGWLCGGHVDSIFGRLRILPVSWIP